jgi:hypothetical protein
MRETVDKKLNAIYRQMASEKTQFLGHTIEQYKDELQELVRRTSSRDLLDYGSGWGKAWPDLVRELGITVHKYDPAIPKFQRKPDRTFDGVTCVDVLEHVPERLVEEVLAEIFDYATRFVLLTVCCRPAKKSFPDGTNMHVTVRPFAWWWERIDAAKRASKFSPLVLVKESP